MRLLISILHHRYNTYSSCIQKVTTDRTQERVVFVVCSLSSYRRPKSSLSMRLLNSIVYLEFFFVLLHVDLLGRSPVSFLDLLISQWRTSVLVVHINKPACLRCLEDYHVVVSDLCLIKWKLPSTEYSLVDYDFILGKKKRCLRKVK